MSLLEYLESLSHRSDPETSKNAAKLGKVRRGNERHRLLFAFAALGPMTYDEAGKEAMVTREYEARRRCSELTGAGMLHDTGLRRPSDRGNPSRVMAITALGLEALEGA